MANQNLTKEIEKTLRKYLKEEKGDILDRAKEIAGSNPLDVAHVSQAIEEYGKRRRHHLFLWYTERGVKYFLTGLREYIPPTVVLCALLAVLFGYFGLLAGNNSGNYDKKEKITNVGNSSNSRTDSFLDIVKIFSGVVIGSATASRRRGR